MRRMTLWLGLASMLAAGCGSGERLDRDVERYLGISQGIYGLVTRFDGAGEEHVLRGVTVNAYTPPMPPAALPFAAIPPGELGPPVASMDTDAHGFYELALDPGDYLVCAIPADPDLPRCTDASVTAGGLARLDFAFGENPDCELPCR